MSVRKCDCLKVPSHQTRHENKANSISNLLKFINENCSVCCDMGAALWLMRLKFVLQKNGKHLVMKLWGYSRVARNLKYSSTCATDQLAFKVLERGVDLFQKCNQQWKGRSHQQRTAVARLAKFTSEGFMQQGRLYAEGHSIFLFLSLSIGKTEQLLENRSEVSSLLSVPDGFGDYASLLDCMPPIVNSGFMDSSLPLLSPRPPQEIRCSFLFKRKIKQMTVLITLSSRGECSSTRTKLEQEQQVIFL